MSAIAVTRVDHVSYTVSDLERSMGFWARFGFEPVNRYSAAGPELDVAVQTTPADMEIQLLRRPDGFTLELICYKRQPDAPAARNSEVGAAHIGFVVEDIERARAELIAAGATFHSAPNVDRYGEKWVYLRDPDGVTVELMQPTPGSQRAVAATGTEA